jgi:hypothetical protein
MVHIGLTHPIFVWLELPDFLAHADSSSRRWAGVVVSTAFPFQTAEDFEEDQVALHILKCKRSDRILELNV